MGIAVLVAGSLATLSAIGLALTEHRRPHTRERRVDAPTASRPMASDPKRRHGHQGSPAREPVGASR